MDGVVGIKEEKMMKKKHIFKRPDKNKTKIEIQKKDTSYPDKLFDNPENPRTIQFLRAVL